MSDYMMLLDAVKDYYGAGSDQWVEIAQYGISSENAYSILSQTPNISTVVSESGDVLGYTIKEVAGVAAQPAGSVINSNTQIATMTEVATTKYPAQMTITQTGEMAATSGTKAVSTGSKVASTAGEVLTVVGAVAAGIQLGTVIDSVLYNANPDFWDDNGMGAINPETWDNICTTQGGKRCFNMIFGIDENNNATQPYLDERAFAYVAQYMNNQGAFNTGTESSEIDSSKLYNTSYTPQPMYLLPSTVICEEINPDAYDNRYRYTYTIPDNVRGFAYVSAGILHLYLGALTQTSVSYDVYNYKDGSESTVTLNMSSSYTTKTGTVVYRLDRNITNENNLTYNCIVNNTVLGDIYWENDTCAMLFDGIISGGPGVEGITPQEDATLPTGITEGMTIDDVITYLKTVYPSLWDDAITNDVIQQDGTIKQFTYVPVGMPDTIPKSAQYGLQPTGGVGTQQDNSTIDDTSPADLIQTLIDIMGTPTPANPTIPTNPTDVPDTGSGSTPAVVTPTGSASALYAVYNPTQEQINSFGSWLWSSNFVDQLKKLFNDPMQSIIGLHKIFATPSTGTSHNIMVGYIDSGVASATVSDQYTTVDCGTVDLHEYFGNVLDYTDTDIYLYLPFVGIVSLNALDVTRATIGVIYKVDVLTGACLASVNVARDGGAGGQLYVYAGNCAVQYPVSSGSYMGIVTGLLGVAGSVVGTMASGGALLPMALGIGASALHGAKTNVQHSGSVSGSAGAMGIKKPYLIIRRPQTKIADNFRVFNGQSENVFDVLENYTGYTRVKYVNLENIAATGEELTEIESILKDGVII